MASRLVIFDVDSLVRLLQHYTEGAVPLDAEAATFEISPYLQRYIGMQVRSSAWPDTHIDPATQELVPLHIRYESNRILKLEHPQDEPAWSLPGAVEAPAKQ